MGTDARRDRVLDMAPDTARTRVRRSNHTLSLTMAR
jgi:hypothetical protein